MIAKVYLFKKLIGVVPDPRTRCHRWRCPGERQDAIGFQRRVQTFYKELFRCDAIEVKIEGEQED